MKFKFSVREIFDKGCFDEFCKKTGISEWAVNEGQLSMEEEFEFSEDDAIEIGLIVVKRYS